MQAKQVLQVEGRQVQVWARVMAQRRHRYPFGLADGQLARSDLWQIAKTPMLSAGLIRRAAAFGLTRAAGH